MKTKTIKLKSYMYFVHILFNILFPNSPYFSTTKPYLKYQEYIQSRIDTEGLKKGIEINKEVRLSVTRYISGSPYSPPFMKVNRDGLPTCLGEMIPLVKSGNREAVKYVLTHLAVTRAFTLPTQPKLDTITSPWKGSLPDISFSNFITEVFLKKYDWRLSLRTDKSDLSYLTTKMGPNGQALKSSLLDLTVTPDNIAEAWGILAPNYFNTLLSLSPFASDLTKALFSKVKSQLPEKVNFRRISAIPDKEGKTRIIAIGDYFSQAILRGIHEEMFRILREFSVFDKTFAQHDHPLEFGKPDQHYHSFDLKDATDRMPIKLQELVLTLLTGDPEGVKAWREILVGQPFNYNGNEYHYNCGQPMGMYSSWTTFTITHHLIVQYCFYKVYNQLPKEGDYIILGDDIVIKDDKVAQEYQSFNMLIDVGISWHKTLRSKTTYEFAKRLIHKGIDLSPYPIWSISKESSIPEIANSLIMIFKQEHLDPNPNQLRLLMGSLISNEPWLMKLVGSLHKTIPLLYSFPLSQRVQLEYNHDLGKYLSIILPGIPCYSENSKELIMNFLLYSVLQESIVEELKKTSYEWVQTLRVLRPLVTETLGQSPILPGIPWISVLESENMRITELYEKVMKLWLWNESTPIPMTNLIVSNPIDLIRERTHVKLLSIRMKLATKVAKAAKDADFTIQGLKDQWTDLVGELSESV